MLFGQDRSAKEVPAAGADVGAAVVVVVGVLLL